MHTNLEVGADYVLRAHAGNPFDPVRVQILEKQGGWVKFAYFHKNALLTAYPHSEKEELFKLGYVLDGDCQSEVDHMVSDSELREDEETERLNEMRENGRVTPHEL